MIETDMDHWDRLPNGEIETSPMAGWEVGAAPGVVLIRLEILTETGQIGSAQLQMPAAQASALGKALQLKAKRALSGRSPE